MVIQHIRANYSTKHEEIALGLLPLGDIWDGKGIYVQMLEMMYFSDSRKSIVHSRKLRRGLSTAKIYPEDTRLVSLGSCEFEETYNTVRKYPDQILNYLVSLPKESELEYLEYCLEQLPKGSISRQELSEKMEDYAKIPYICSIYELWSKYNLAAGPTAEISTQYPQSKRYRVTFSISEMPEKIILAPHKVSCSPGGYGASEEDRKKALLAEFLYNISQPPSSQRWDVSKRLFLG
jgi:hypothetical protein